MGTVQNPPQAAFARFVRRAIDEARGEHGWTVSELAAHTGIGRSTLFRWLAGDWQDYPELAKVRSFCTALQVPVVAAFRALGLPDLESGRPAERDGSPERSGPPQGDGSAQIDGFAQIGGDEGVAADLRVILDRLADPAVPADEKAFIRDQLRHLARRPGQRRLSTPAQGTTRVNSAVRTTPPVLKSKKSR